MDTFEENPLPKEASPLQVFLSQIVGVIPTSTAAPSWIPRNIAEQFTFYNGALYAYDTATGTWIQLAAGTSSRARAYLASNFSFNTLTAVPFDTELYDALNEFNTSDGKFTASAAGYYLVHGHLYFPSLGNNIFGARIYVNGTEVAHSADYVSSADSGAYTSEVTDIVHLSANDYVQIYAHQNNISAIVGGNQELSYVAIHRLS